MCNFFHPFKRLADLRFFAAAFLTLSFLTFFSAPSQAACSSPAGTAGQLLYDAGDSVMVYCDNTNWIEFPKVAGGGGGGGVLSISQISAGGDFACAVMSDGTLWCWGDGNFGKMGNNDASESDQASPVQVGTSGTNTLWTDWTKVSAGLYGACGVRSNGTAWCWGRGNYGRLGNNTTSDSRIPVQVGTSGTSTLWSDWSDIAVGFRMACGLRSNGTAWCWGDPYYGSLGDGGTSQQNVPVQVGTSGTSTLWSDWTDITAGRSYACGLRSDGSAWCWGEAGQGRLGNNDATTLQTTPVRVGTAGTSTLWSDWVSIDIGHWHTCGLRNNGTAWCWGYNAYGQLGQELTGNQLVPARVGTSASSTLWSDWASVTASENSSCGVRSDGSAWCWGSNYYGELGNDDTEYVYTPTRVGTSTTNTLWSDWTTLEGYTANCGIRSDGSGWCWGPNTSGAVGSGSIGGNKLIPTEVGVEDPYTLTLVRTQSSKAAASPWATDSVSVQAGESLLVCVSSLASITGITWNGQSLTQEVANTGSGINTYIYSLYNVSSFAFVPLQISMTGGDTLAFGAVTVKGMVTTSPLDQSSASSGSSTSVSSGNPGTTTQDRELVFGCVGANGPTDSVWGTWGNEFNGLGRVGTSGQGATSNVTLDVGAKTVEVTGVYPAALSYTDPVSWSAAVATYKLESPALEGYGGAATGCTSPTGVAGLMLYDAGDNVLTYCNGSTWVEAGPSPGAGGAGCSSPSGVAGSLIYDNGDSVLTYCDGSNWIQIGK